MSIRHCIVLLAMAVLLLPRPAHAQLDISRASLHLGAIRTANVNGGEHVWPFYPEVEGGGQLFAPFLTWGVTWGYWTTESDPMSDGPGYSLKGHIVTGRIGFLPQVLSSHFPLPLSLSAGLAEHILNTTYTGGTDYSGKPGTNSSATTMTAVVALGVSVPIVPRVNLEAQFEQFIPFGSREIDKAQQGRRALTVGLGVGF